MGTCSLFQGIFPNQGLNPGLPHCRQILYQLSHQGSPRILEQVAFPSLQGIFPTQGLNPGLPHCRQILYQLSHQGSPRVLEWVAYPFSSRSFWPRNRTRVSCIVGRFFTSWATREGDKEFRNSPDKHFCAKTLQLIHPISHLCIHAIKLPVLHWAVLSLSPYIKQVWESCGEGVRRDKLFILYCS